MITSITGPDIENVFTAARSKQSKKINIGNESFTITKPFPSPADWRDQWIYFLLIDRFNNPQSPPATLPYDSLSGTFQGGTFNGIREKLKYLKDLGTGAIWLSPVLKNCIYNPFTYHGYGIQDFLQIDPRFSSDPEAAKVNPEIAEEELEALVNEAHALGIYIIFDIVLNHTGNVFAYALNNGDPGHEADFSNTPYIINWRDENGNGRSDWNQPPDNAHHDALVWPLELQNNEFFRRQGKGGEEKGDFASLKEMVTDFQAPEFPVRNILIRAYQYLIAKYDIDGYRIDTLKFIEPEFARIFGNAMREYALSIGKKNFFTFGEVYDNEEQIARFIGRHATQDGDIVGVDAALDFPLFFKLPGVVKGSLPPTEIIFLFEHRKNIIKDIISSHGEAGRYFIKFADNHDQHRRFYFSNPENPVEFEDQLTLAISCLFALQGIPSLYYGTEQGLHGVGNDDRAVREALWGKPEAFDQQHSLFTTIKNLSALRNLVPALRYGRQYFRQISGDGIHFGFSSFPNGVLAFSRILNSEEVLIVANTNTVQGWSGDVIIDRALNPVNSTYEVLFTNKELSQSGENEGELPGPVIEKSGSVEIHEINGSITSGPVRSLRINLSKMEIQILQLKKN